MRVVAILLLVICGCKASTEINTSGTGDHGRLSGYIFAGTADSAGIYRSSDQGRTWQQATATFSTGYKIWGFASAGQDLFCSCLGEGVYRSSDSGLTWTKLVFPGKNPYAITALDSLLVVADDILGIYGSTDRGETWQWRNSQLTRCFVHSFLRVGSTLLACSERKGISVSSDFGFTWDSRDSQRTGATDVHALALNSSALFAGISGTWLLFSTDFGTTWAAATFGNNISQNVWALLPIDTDMYAGTTQGVIRSTNRGLSWFSMNVTLPDKDVRSLVYDGANIYAATNGQGIYRSGDRGESWVAVNTGLRSMTVPTLLVR